MELDLLWQASAISHTNSKGPEYTSEQKGSMNVQEDVGMAQAEKLTKQAQIVHHPYSTPTCPLK